MKNRSNLSVVSMAVILITLLLLAACQPDAAPRAATNNADVTRWVALGEALSGKRSAAAEGADQARWEAAGDDYLVYAGERPLSAHQADQARWTAMTEFYSQSNIIHVLSKSIQ